MSQSLFYSQYTRYYVAVDCVIFGFNGDDLDLMLIKRSFNPGKGEWALPGGFIEPNESAAQASKRILKEHTGISDVYLEQYYTFTDVDRDPGARIISIAYYALIKVEESNNELVSLHNAYWKKVSVLPKLMFDHGAIAEKALDQLRLKAKHQPIGFELLPECFTIPQLQKLYEAIYQKKYDKRNFRKKIAHLGLMEKLNVKDKTGSKRGAFLYKFNKSKYKILADKGIAFEI